MIFYCIFCCFDCYYSAKKSYKSSSNNNSNNHETKTNNDHNNNNNNSNNHETKTRNDYNNNNNNNKSSSYEPKTNKNNGKNGQTLNGTKNYKIYNSIADSISARQEPARIHLNTNRFSLINSPQTSNFIQMDKTTSEPKLNQRDYKVICNYCTFECKNENELRLHFLESHQDFFEN